MGEELSRRFDAMHARLHEMSARFDAMHARFDGFAARFAGPDRRLRCLAQT